MNLRRLIVTLGLLLWLPATPASAAITQLVSTGTAGEPANGHCDWPVITPDGRYVAFHSDASNVVPGDTNGCSDVFVADRDSGGLTRASVAGDGTQGNDDSFVSAISADGRYVAFVSHATNLVDGDTNSAEDVFLHDLLTGQTARVSVSSDGLQPMQDSFRAALSADGRYVAFSSRSPELDPEDTNIFYDVFLHDRLTGETVRVSVAGDGSEGNGDSLRPAITADGRYIAFESTASNLVPGDSNNVYDVFVHDMETGETERVSVASDGTQGNDESRPCATSADGRHIVFHSAASNLVPDDTNDCWDVFVHDMETGETERVSVSTDGIQGNARSGLLWMDPSISSDGRYVTFTSEAWNLVPGDTNAARDVFVHDRLTGRTWRASLRGDGSENPGHSEWSSITADGAAVVFEAQPSLMLPGETEDNFNIFVRDQLEFWDIADDFWARDAIRACAAAAIVSGYNNGYYHPEWPVSRDQMAAYISRSICTPTGEAGLLDYDPPATPSFTDVATDYWAYKYIEYAAEHTIVGGYEDGTYRPQVVLDRAQMAVFIARALVTPSGDAGVPDPVGDPTFPDVTPDSDWAWCSKHVEYIAAEGVCGGYEDDCYHPEYVCTRDQMAVYICRAFHLP